MRKFILSLLLYSSIQVFGMNQPKYPVSVIPDSLMSGMYAVIREQSTDFEISTLDKSTMRFRRVITILNAQSKEYASIHVEYDKLIKVVDINASVYDANGILIKQIKQSDVRDQKSVDHSTLFDDNRVKWVDLAQSTYPYTVEYEWTIQFKSLYFIPDLMLFEDDEISIQHLFFRISYPKALRPKYRLTNIMSPKIQVEDDRENLVWAFQNTVPQRFEPYSKIEIPSVQFSPNQFEYAGYPGNMSSWKDYGKWQYSLNAGRDVLPEATIDSIQALVRQIPDEKRRVKAIYEFMQNKTRYVGVQLGIGGFQPFDAAAVDKTGYGDCKALSNYMISLLKAANIKGYYCKIYGGANTPEIHPSFADNVFNHIIVSVPLKQDTVWLECTSQTQPFGFLGSFTADRYALLVNEDGGHLVRTPAYKEKVNVMNRTVKVNIDDAGNAIADVISTYSGLRYESKGLDQTFSSPEDQKKWIESTTAIPSFHIKKFSVTDISSDVPSALVSVQYDLPRFSSISGKRMFLSPNIMNRSSFIPVKDSDRRSSIIESTAKTDIDSVIYALPVQYHPEYLPPPLTLESKFGKYECRYDIQQGTLVYIRKLIVRKGEFPAQSYQEFVDFYKAINKADNTKVVLVSKT